MGKVVVICVGKNSKQANSNMHISGYNSILNQPICLSFFFFFKFYILLVDISTRHKRVLLVRNLKAISRVRLHSNSGNRLTLFLQISSKIPLASFHIFSENPDFLRLRFDRYKVLHSSYIWRLWPLGRTEKFDPVIFLVMRNVVFLKCSLWCIWIYCWKYPIILYR